MGFRGIANLIDGLHGGIHGGVESDGIVRAPDIIIDGARETKDCPGPMQSQVHTTPKGPVSAYGQEVVHIRGPQPVRRFTDPNLSPEFLAAGSVEKGSAFLDDVGDVPGNQGPEFPALQPFVPAHHT